MTTAADDDRRRRRWSLRGETFDDKLSSVARLLLDDATRVVVLAGAGISVSCGIPDFRSQDGLYNTLDCQELGLACPEDLFDVEAFRDDPRPFYRFARSLYPGRIDPGPSHEFLARLDGRNKLLRVYTQNIDGLEEKAGVRADRVVYAHGSLLGATCTRCRAAYLAGDIEADVRAGTVPRCRRPTRDKKRKARPPSSSSSGPSSEEAKKPPAERRRSARRASSARRGAPGGGADDDGSSGASSMPRGLCGGVIKPNVTFFGEKLRNDVGRSLARDRDRADVLLVMGTSLSVAPMSKVIEFLPPDVPRILINRDVVRPPRASGGGEDGRPPFDACLLGDCDDAVRALEAKAKGGEGREGGTATTANDRGSVAGVDGDRQPRGGRTRGNVLLFPGASIRDSEEPPEEPKNGGVVVHCDACGREIRGEIYCCRTCFDYDLCGACYPAAAATHADGKHEFAVER